MKKIHLAIMTGCLVLASTASANLVGNGGFEAGIFSPWTAVNSVLTTTAANVHSGTYAAQLNAITSEITQTVPIIGGGKYALDFWAMTDGEGALTVTLDSAFVVNIPFSGASAYTHYSFPSITALSVGDITFKWSDGANRHAFVDDVNLVPVPEPSTYLAGALLLLPFAASTMRRLRKNRTA